MAWTHKTDREIIREAASKKFVPLAEKFLCLRNNADIDHIKEIISKEVFQLTFRNKKEELIYYSFTDFILG